MEILNPATGKLLDVRRIVHCENDLPKHCHFMQLIEKKECKYLIYLTNQGFYWALHKDRRPKQLAMFKRQL